MQFRQNKSIVAMDGSTRTNNNTHTSTQSTKGKISINVLITNVANEKPQTLSVSIDLNKEYPLSDNIKETLVDIFCMLHPIITGSFYNGPVPKLTPKELFHHALEDDCLLTRCMYALGTSYSSWEQEKVMTNPYWASSLMAAFTASQVIGRLVTM